MLEHGFSVKVGDESTVILGGGGLYTCIPPYSAADGQDEVVSSAFGWEEDNSVSEPPSSTPRFRILSTFRE